MVKIFRKIRHSLIPKLLILVGLSLFLSLSVWAYFNIKYQKKKTDGWHRFECRYPDHHD
jgi:hypothetical protein